MDRAGRLVIPRALRNRIGLAEGGEVEIEVDGSGIRIEAVSGVDLQEENGLLVIPDSGIPVDDALIQNLIDEDRHRH